MPLEPCQGPNPIAVQPEETGRPLIILASILQCAAEVPDPHLPLALKTGKYARADIEGALFDRVNLHIPNEEPV